MNNDLISREALKKKLQARNDNGEEDFDKGYNIGIETAIDLIDNAPTVKVFTEEYVSGAYNEGYMCGSREAEKARPQGEWSFNPYDSYSYCSLCKVKAPFGYKNFCPNCGADMRKGGAE